MGDWAFQRGGGTGLVTVGTNAASSRGTNVATPAAANTEGSWTQIVASTSVEAAGFYVSINNTAGAGVHLLMDIGIGAGGSEVSLVDDLYWCRHSQVNCLHAFIPMRVPRGVRMAARLRSSAGTAQTVRVSYHLVPESPFLLPGFGACDSINVNTATSRDTTSVDPGASTNTKGSYAQLVASTANPIRALLLAIGSGSGSPTSRTAAADALLDVAIGGSGSEQIILPDLQLYAGTSEDSWQPGFLGPFPVNIPAGTRIAARMQSTNATSGQREAGVLAYGFR